MCDEIIHKGVLRKYCKNYYYEVIDKNGEKVYFIGGRDENKKIILMN